MKACLLQIIAGCILLGSSSRSAPAFLLIPPNVAGDPDAKQKAYEAEAQTQRKMETASLTEKIKTSRTRLARLKKDKQATKLHPDTAKELADEIRDMSKRLSQLKKKNVPYTPIIESQKITTGAIGTLVPWCKDHSSDSVCYYSVEDLKKNGEVVIGIYGPEEHSSGVRTMSGQDLSRAIQSSVGAARPELTPLFLVKGLDANKLTIGERTEINVPVVILEKKDVNIRKRGNQLAWVAETIAFKNSQNADSTNDR